MQKSNGKNYRIIALACLAIILVVGGMGGLLYAKVHRVIPVASAVSPDGRVEVSLQQLGEPDWPYGNTDGRLLVKENGRKMEQVPLTVANDGKNLSEENWQVSWNPGTLAVTILGEEQAPATYRFTLDGTR